MRLESYSQRSPRLNVRRGSHAPVVLSVAGDVAVEDGGNGNRDHGRAALEADGLGDIEIVDLSIAIEIGKAEVGDQDHGAGAEDIDLAIGGIVLEFAAEVQRVLAKGPGERVAHLIAIQMRGLGKVEVRAIGKVGEDELIGQIQLPDW